MWRGKRGGNGGKTRGQMSAVRCMSLSIEPCKYATKPGDSLYSVWVRVCVCLCARVYLHT